MIGEWFTSLKDNISYKSTNPFFGTFILVVLARNWELLYSIFTFDSFSTRVTRIGVIKSYLNDNLDFWNDLLNNILISLGIVIGSYILINLTRLISNIFEKKLTPWIYKITDKNSVVLRTTHENVRNERDNLQKRLDQERDSKGKLETRIKELEDELLDTNNNQPSEPQVNDIKSDSKNIDKVVNKLKSKKLGTAYEQCLNTIRKGYSVSSTTDGLDDFLALGLLVFEKWDVGDNNIYKITELGEEVFNKIYIGE